MIFYQALGLALAISSSLVVMCRHYKLVQSTHILTGAGIALAALTTLLPQTLSFFAPLMQLITAEVFPDFMVQGILCYLLFAGSLSVCTTHLRRSILSIVSLALFTTVLAIVGHTLLFMQFSQFFRLGLSSMACICLAIAVAPTDPVAVLALQKALKVPVKIQTLIAGESLLNDGIALVFLSCVLSVYQVSSSTSMSLLQAAYHLCYDVVGGCGLGFVLALILTKILQSLEGSDSLSCWLSSLALLSLCTFLAPRLHLSAALTTVFFGLFFKDRWSSLAQTQQSCLLNFWHTLEDSLNALVFFMVGLQASCLWQGSCHPVLLLVMPALSLLIRYLSVLLPLASVSFLHKEPLTLDYPLIALSGLKGALSLAMIQSLVSTLGPHYPALMQIACTLVLSSIMIQTPMVEFQLTRKRSLVSDNSASQSTEKNLLTAHS